MYLSSEKCKNAYFLDGKLTMTINQRLFEIMTQKNIKAVDLAKKLNINKTVVSAWKNRGTNPPIEYTVQICELLEISIEYYITGKEKQNLLFEEQSLLDAYHQADISIQIAVRKLLDVPEQDSRSSAYEIGREII